LFIAGRVYETLKRERMKTTATFLLPPIILIVGGWLVAQYLLRRT